MRLVALNLRVLKDPIVILLLFLNLSKEKIVNALVWIDNLTLKITSSKPLHYY